MKQFCFEPDETLRRMEPANLGLVYTSFQRFVLHDENLMVKSGGEELCFAVLSGSVSYTYGAQHGIATMWDILYLPIEEEIILQAQDAVLVQYGAPCVRKTSFAHIEFSTVDADVRHKTYGTPESGTRREVWNYIDESFDSSRFLVGMCHGAPGAWTAWPPHEHGEKREEVYVYFGMDDGFGLQCVYTKDEKKQVYPVQNGTLVTIPEGYHPNVGCPKTGIRYFYCMVSITAEDRNFMDLHIQSKYGDRLE